MPLDEKHTYQPFYAKLTMAYKRKYYMTAKRYGVKKQKTAMSVAKKALSGVRAIERKIEDKFVNTVRASTAITDAGIIDELFPTVQGANFGQRVGNTMHAKWMRIAYESRAVGGSSSLRIIIFRDNQQEADTDPTIAQVLQSVSHLSPINHLNKSRFKILRDTNTSMTVSSANAVVNKVVYIKLNFQQKYNGTAATDIDKNGIYILMLGSAPTNDPLFEYNASLIFTDL